MNNNLLQFWLNKAIRVAQRNEFGRNVLTKERVKQVLLERMCEIARHADDKYELAINANMRYCDSKHWYSFEPGIFEMLDFREIIDENLSGIMKDKQRKTPHYIRTIASSLMNQFYRENPNIDLN